MKNAFHKLLFLMIAVVFYGVVSYSQAKKIPGKKAVVTTQSRSTAASHPIAKSVQPAKPHTATPGKKITKPVNTVNPRTVNTTIPNKPVSNAEITNVTLSGREQEMINEINNLRANPARYCVYVEHYLQKYETDDEVKSAAKEFVVLLKKMKPLTPLAVSTTLYNDARQYGMLMARKNIFEHSSLPYYENLSLGHKDIRDAIIDLLIDDGIPDRGHRNNLLSEKIKSVAVYELPGKVQNIAYCYVQEFK